MELGDGYTKLVYGVNRKDEKAWQELFDSYYESLCHHAARILLDDHVAKALTVYLYRSVTNNALKYLRDRNTEEARLRLWNEVELEMSEEDFSSVVREEVLRKLRELIDLLPGERRKVILMSMDGMSGEEIAVKLGVTIHTVKQQKYLAYKFIKQELGKFWIVAMLFFL